MQQYSNGKFACTFNMMQKTCSSIFRYNENIFLLLKKKDVDFDYKSCFLFQRFKVNI